ncbi:hypothetical protein FRAHR75_150024 [Frankia sp. Hr75.2]|nr:hypothetical protein FRAHR75_150024 [Frankia sp. Hr75.2]
MHLPEPAVRPGDLGRQRGGECVGMDVEDREVPEHLPDLAVRGVDQLVQDGGRTGTVGALEVAVLDDHHRRARLTPGVAPGIGRDAPALLPSSPVRLAGVGPWADTRPRRHVADTGRTRIPIGPRAIHRILAKRTTRLSGHIHANSRIFFVYHSFRNFHAFFNWRPFANPTFLHESQHSRQPQNPLGPQRSCQPQNSRQPQYSC